MNFHNFQTTRGISGGNGRIKTRVGQSQNQRQRPNQNQAGSRQTNLQRQALLDNYPLELLDNYPVTLLDNYPLELLDNYPEKLLLDTQPLELLGKQKQFEKWQPV
jgi:hypothetical protein